VRRSIEEVDGRDRVDQAGISLGNKTPVAGQNGSAQPSPSSP
jgi:hypothetical protein